MQLVKVEFHSHSLEVEPQSQSVVVKDICRNIGLVDYKSQIKKLKSDPTFQSKLIKVQTNGGMQEVFTIPLSKLNGWLFSINPNRVKPEVKERLIEYKNECFDVLYRHFNKSTQTKNENTPYIHQLERENIELRRSINRLSLESHSEEFKNIQFENKRLKRTLIQFKDNYHNVVQKADNQIEAMKKELQKMTNVFQMLPNVANDGNNLNTDTVAKHSYW